MNTFEIAAIALQQDAERLRGIAQNVANVSTAGYKRQISIQRAFVDVLDANRGVDALLTTPLTVGKPGKLRATGQALDIALPENHFLVVQLADGAMGLTRNGSLMTDAALHLATSDGLAVQGTTGPIAVPRGARDVRIDAAGNVTADDVSIGTLRVVQTNPQSRLEALGGGVFVMDANVVSTAGGFAGIQSGFLEGSNVNGSLEMTALMTTMRHAESMARLMQGVDEVIGQSIRKFGEAA